MGEAHQPRHGQLQGGSGSPLIGNWEVEYNGVMVMVCYDMLWLYIKT